MNISRENVDALNAVITLNIEKADYEPKYEAALKNYAKKANVPGFRPGKVPVAMLRKQVGKALLAEEVNKFIDEAINNYIKENDLNLVGQPLPVEGQAPIDFDQEVNDITLKFDLGIAPKIEIDLEKIKVENYTIDVEDADVDAQVKMSTQRFGKQEAVEAVSETSMIKGSVKGEFNNETTVISANVMKDEKQKKKFVGKKVGDTVKFDIKKTFPNDTEISYILGISKEEAANVSGDYEFTISEITDFKEAELTQEIFDSVYGKDVVKSVEEFKAKAKEDVEAVNAMQTDALFAHKLRKALLASQKIELPEAFMKRWLTVVNADNKNFTAEVLEKEFPELLDEYRWTEIRQSIAQANDIKIKNEDVIAFAIKQAKAQFAQYGMYNVPAQYLENYAKNMLENQEQREQCFMGAVNDAVVAFAKTKVKLSNKSCKRADLGKLFED